MGASLFIGLPFFQIRRTRLQAGLAWAIRRTFDAQNFAVGIFEREKMRHSEPQLFRFILFPIHLFLYLYMRELMLAQVPFRVIVRSSHSLLFALLENERFRH